ncbi:MAG TPA: hypothetical protein VMR19_02905 [Candidatus Saccharimonadales bacterium]|nr:hypothetical protein [Candidatus Saccharimonadales bacterium]
MILEITGWLGTGLILLAYLLVSIKKIEPTSGKYQLLNLFGAIGVGLNSLIHRALPSVGINLAWILIAIYALVRSRKTS